MPSIQIIRANLDLKSHQDAVLAMTGAYSSDPKGDAKPLINIHDLFVLPSNRGQGIARSLPHAIYEEARSSDCCKLTLEVLQSNTPARAIYDRIGFGSAVYAGNLAGEPCYFLSKKVT